MSGEKRIYFQIDGTLSEGRSELCGENTNCFWNLLLNILPLAKSPVSFGNCDKSKEHLNEKCNKLYQDQLRSAMEGSISIKSISLTS